MFVYWAGDGMGLVCKKRAADGLSYLSFTTVAQLSSDKGAACIPLEKTLTHPPTPSLPPPRPRQVPLYIILPLWPSQTRDSSCWLVGSGEERGSFRG